MLEMDFETYCEKNVRLIGAYAYCDHPSLEVLVLAYKINKGKIKRWIPAYHEGLPASLRKYQSETIPQDLQDYIENTDKPIGAHNSQFEMCVWNAHMVPVLGAPPIAPHRWRCTAAMCAAAGLPRSLEKAGAAMHLDIQKDKEGTRLLNIFAKPRKPTKANPATRTYPKDKPEEFEALCKYCETDVAVEYELRQHVPDLAHEDYDNWEDFQLDIKINERGLPLDMEAVHGAYALLTELERRLAARVSTLTGGVRATQRDKMLAHFSSMGLDLENLQAKTIKDLVAVEQAKHPDERISDELLELLLLRLEGGKASTKKLKKMIEVCCRDMRVHGAFMFYGAHTGRWSGKLIQPQNFTRGDYKPDQLDLLFFLLGSEDADVLEFMYQWPIDAIAKGIRGFIKAKKGRKLVVCDFSAIEARVLAWIAQQHSTLELYYADADLYKKLAVKLYKLNSESEVVDEQRKFAKDVFLGCGYQLGGPGFQMNCMKRGIVIDLEFAKLAVQTYRDENPKVVQLWKDVERKAIRAVESGATATNAVHLRQLAFFVDGVWFCVRLPSGRLLRYAYPKVEMAERFGRQVKKLTYRAEYKGKWIRESTYGGKLVENIIQAIARDIMVYACHKAEAKGYKTIGTVHDELIMEVKKSFGSAQELIAIMRDKPEWAIEAPINAAGWESERYRK